MAWEPVDPQSDAPPGLGFDPRKTRATDIDPYVYGGEPVQQPRMDIPVATPLPGLAIEPAQRKPGAMVGLAMVVSQAPRRRPGWRRRAPDTSSDRASSAARARPDWA